MNGAMMPPQAFIAYDRDAGTLLKPHVSVSAHLPPPQPLNLPTPCPWLSPRLRQDVPVYFPEAIYVRNPPCTPLPLSGGGWR